MEQSNLKDKLLYKMKNNRSIQYYIMCGFFIMGITFFLSSNMIFNKEFSLMSTELGKKFFMKNIVVELKSRQYNPNNGLIQLNLKVENSNINNKEPFRVELREKSNPQEIIPSTLVKVSNTDYIVYAKLISKWSAISLTVLENIHMVNGESYIKLYSDARDIEVNNELVEKNKESYTVEIIEEEITELIKEIEKVNEDILEKENLISQLNDTINSMEEEKKYQTESEIFSAETTIQSNLVSINSLKIDIEILSKNKNELEEKIQKLEVKKKDLMNLVY